MTWAKDGSFVMGLIHFDTSEFLMPASFLLRMKHPPKQSTLDLTVHVALRDHHIRFFLPFSGVLPTHVTDSTQFTLEILFGETID